MDAQTIGILAAIIGIVAGILGGIVAAGTIWTWVRRRVKRDLDELRTLLDSSIRLYVQEIVETDLNKIRDDIAELQGWSAVLRDSDNQHTEEFKQLDARIKELESQVAEVATSLWPTPKQSN